MRLTALWPWGKVLYKPIGHAPQHRGALHQGDGNPGVGDVQGGPEARRAPADHQGGPGQGHPALGQGNRIPHLGQPHADQLQGLHQGRVRFPGVHPGAVLPEVDDFQEIGVDAVFGQQVPKGGLVELGGAGRHHQAVQAELLDILGDILLARLGAGVEMIPAHRHPRQTPGRVRQGHRADDPGDIVAAVADVEADVEVVAHKDFGEKGEKAKRRKGKNIAIKLIPWKVSHKIMVTFAIPIIWWHRRLACADAG